MIFALIALSLAMPRPAPVMRLACVQARIDSTMDLGTIKRLNADWARLDRGLDERDMRVDHER